MLIRNVRLHNKNGLYDIFIHGGCFDAITPAGARTFTDTDTIDAKGMLALPPFVDPHVHLDAALTAGQPVWNKSGTLFEGIQNWSERKKTLTRDDVLKRACRAIDWYTAQGVQVIRSHVDITDPSLTALHALLELRESVKDRIEIQIVAFPQEGINSFCSGRELLEEALKLGADVVGGVPHLEYTREYGLDSLQTIFSLAEKYNALIDIHCDEIDDGQSRFVETVAAMALERSMGERVTASHTTAMHSYENAYMFKLVSLLQKSGVHFIANPVTNLNLQGRMDSYPKRRGITRVDELLAANINVAFGQDDIVDPWFPMLGCNMLQVLFCGLVGCHMTGQAQINESIDLITTNSAKAMHVMNEYGIEEGKPGNLILLDSYSTFDAIRRQATVTHSIRNGQLIAKTAPPRSGLYSHGESRPIDFYI